LLDAALDLFCAQGYGTTTLSDIARKAGVSKGTVYLYFENKEALLVAAVREALLPILELGERRLADPDTASTVIIRQLMHDWWDDWFNRRATGVHRLIVCEAHHFPNLTQLYLEQVMGRGRRLFADLVRRGIARGEFGAVHDPDMVGRLLTGQVAYAMVLAHSVTPTGNPAPAPRALIDAHVDLCLSGLKRHD
jgi:AcrR family transcriptional regulator